MQRVYVISDREMAELQNTQEILFALTDTYETATNADGDSYEDEICRTVEQLKDRMKHVMSYAKKAEEVLSHIVTLGNAESSVTVTDFKLGK